MFDASGFATRLAERLQSTRVRLSLAASALLLGLAVNVAPALAVTGASGVTGCVSTSATTLLGYVNYTAEALIGIGAMVSLFMFALGGCFIIFGYTPKQVDKGMEMIKQTMIGLAVLAGGVFIKVIVIDVVFGASATKVEKMATSC